MTPATNLVCITLFIVLAHGSLLPSPASHSRLRDGQTIRKTFDSINLRGKIVVIRTSLFTSHLIGEKNHITYSGTFGAIQKFLNTISTS